MDRWEQINAVQNMQDYIDQHKRGINAKEYFAYCEEIGCDIWGLLCSVKEALYEPIGLWLPGYIEARPVRRLNHT